MTPLSPRPSNRLDWQAIWDRYDTFSQRKPNPLHVSATARLEIQNIVENALADREGALNP